MISIIGFSIFNNEPFAWKNTPNIIPLINQNITFIYQWICCFYIANYENNYEEKDYYELSYVYYSGIILYGE